MAVTFVESTRIDFPANKFLPVANPINITVNSNNTGKCNFRYVCDVWIDGVNSLRLKLFPDPVTGYGFFQLSDVVNDYLTEYLPNNNTAAITVGTTAQNKSVCQVQLRFGEEYDNSTLCDGEIIVYPDLLTSNDFYVYLGAFDYLDWPTYNSNDWVINNYSATGSQIDFLTNRPRGSAECSINESYYLDWLSVPAPDAGVTRINVLTNTGNYSFFNAPNLPLSTKRFRASCGPHDINRAKGSPDINTSVDYYDVWIDQGLTFSIIGNQLTEKFRIYVKKPSKFRTRFGFIGLLGSPEYFTFFHRNRKAFDIDRKDYKKYLTSNKSNSWTYEVGDRQMTTYATSAKERHFVNTFVDPESSEWLYEMWLSTNVWIEDKPYTTEFRVFKEIRGKSITPSRMLFWLNDTSQFSVGDQFFAFPDNNPQWVDYLDLFTIQSIEGNIIDCGLMSDVYNLTVEACGWLVKNEPARKIPVVISDNAIEVKQKTGKQIEYSLQYSNSVDKITLRG
jgi:hypothetical protein